MTVSMLKFNIQIPYSSSLKDKRRVVKSIKDKLINKFKVSAAEVEMLDSLQAAQIGVALVSNSREFGESVMHKAIDFVDKNFDCQLMDYQVISEFFG